MSNSLRNNMVWEPEFPVLLGKTPEEACSALQGQGLKCAVLHTSAVRPPGDAELRVIRIRRSGQEAEILTGLFQKSGVTAGKGWQDNPLEQGVILHREATGDDESIF